MVNPEFVKNERAGTFCSVPILTFKLVELSKLNLVVKVNAGNDTANQIFSKSKGSFFLSISATAK